MAHQKILVPLDGSRFGEWALPPAFSLARRFGAEVEIVSIYDDQPSVGGWPVSAEGVKQWFETYHQELVKRAQTVEGVTISTTILGGSTTKQLEDYANGRRPLLLVMATHGRGPLSRAWLGSVADHVVRHVPMPVLLVRPDADTAGEVDFAHLPEFRRFAVGLDGSDRAEASLEWARRVGQGVTDAAYLLIRVVPPHYATSPYLPHTITESQQVLEEEQTEARAYLEEIVDRFGGGDEVVTDVPVGIRPASGILRSADEFDADLVVIATHGRSGPARVVFGSVADKVVRGAEIPVLLIRNGTS